MGNIFGLFGSRFNFYMILALLIAVIGGATAWKIDSLIRERREIQMKNDIKELRENLLTTTEEFRQYQENAKVMSEQMERLNRKMNQNSAIRDTTNKDILPQSQNSKELEAGANRLNDVFDRIGSKS